MNISNQILEFSEEVNRYGYAVIIRSVSDGMSIPLISSYQPIQDLPGGSLYRYLSNMHKRTKPDKFIVTAKKRNGTGLKNPKIFELLIEQSAPTALSGTQDNNMRERSFSEPIAPAIPSIPNQQVNSVNDPISQMYRLQIENLERELKKYTEKADKYERDYEKVRNSNFDLQRQLDTIEEKHKLNIEKERVSSENTLAGFAKELKPEIQGLLGTFINRNEQIPQAQLAGPDQSTPAGKMITLFSQLLTSSELPLQLTYFEMLMRFAQLSEASQNKLIGLLQQQTESFNAAFEAAKNEIV